MMKAIYLVTAVLFSCFGCKDSMYEDDRNMGIVTTTISKLLSNPDKYSGNFVKVQGFLSVDDVGLRLKTKRQADSDNSTGVLRITDYSEGIVNTRTVENIISGCTDRLVFVVGLFAYHGEWDKYGLEKVERVGFVSNESVKEEIESCYQASPSLLYFKRDTSG